MGCISIYCFLKKCNNWFFLYHWTFYYSVKQAQISMPCQFSANSGQLLFDARLSEAEEGNLSFLHQNTEILQFNWLVISKNPSIRSNHIIIIILNEANLAAATATDRLIKQNISASHNALFRIWCLHTVYQGIPTSEGLRMGWIWFSSNITIHNTNDCISLVQPSPVWSKCMLGLMRMPAWPGKGWRSKNKAA